MDLRIFLSQPTFVPLTHPDYYANMTLPPRLPLLSALILLTLTVPALPQTPPPAKADPRIAAILSTIGKAHTVNQAAISPDSKHLAYSVREGKGQSLHLITLPQADAGKEQIVSTGNGATDCANHDPIWSPNGSQLAFISTCTEKENKAGQPQIFLYDVAKGTSHQLTHVTGAVTFPAWSPDGKAIAFLFVENATRNAGATGAIKPLVGVIGQDNVEVQGVYAIYPEMLLKSVHAAASEQGQSLGGWLVMPSEKLHVYEFSWAPNSREIAFIAAPPPGENNWWVARLYRKEVLHALDSRPSWAGHLDAVFDPAKTTSSLQGMQLALPRYSPDGKAIAFLGGLMSDQGQVGGDIYTIPTTGGEPTDITPGRPATPAWIDWHTNDTITVSEHVASGVHIFRYNTSTRSEEKGFNLTLPATTYADENVLSLSLAKDDTVAMVQTDFTHPTEVFAGKLDHLQQITHVNDGAKPVWGRAESVEWTNEGYHAQGWLLYPAHYDAAKKYPMVVVVHGGPSNLSVARWPAMGSSGVPLSALDYFVFMPNPRGSYGQGEKFTQANVKDFGYGDLRDILAGVDAVEKKYPVDDNRLGITGWSYGGFMTMFTVTQTQRFKAAVAGAGISNWQSYYGENSIDQWMIPFFGASVYDDPAIYAKSSAINYIKNVKT
ncbi:MAG: prolyl oligopeptidase family serine peptidase, partial [Acidobacteriaceae bacterium]|nr:prolyl oligopeptidase family serine peptidase [Acidobacteriaceae bacterium]